MDLRSSSAYWSRERERQRERDKECSNFIRILLFVKDLIHNRKSYFLSNKLKEFIIPFYAEFNVELLEEKDDKEERILSFDFEFLIWKRMDFIRDEFL